MYQREDLKLANANDVQELLEFYHSFIGSEGCTWSLDYPSKKDIESDIRRQSLFFLRDEKGIIASISIDDDPNVDGLAVWTIANARESARLGVRSDMQNRGIARFMLQMMMDILKEQGYDGIHFLVSRFNHAALASYARLGFTNRGELTLYGEQWYCYEKQIS